MLLQRESLHKPLHFNYLCIVFQCPNYFLCRVTHSILQFIYFLILCIVFPILKIPVISGEPNYVKIMI